MHANKLGNYTAILEPASNVVLCV